MLRHSVNSLNNKVKTLQTLKNRTRSHSQSPSTTLFLENFYHDFHAFYGEALTLLLGSIGLFLVQVFIEKVPDHKA